MSKISFVAPVEKTHLTPLSTVLANVWQDAPDFYRDEYIGNSHYDWQASRIALHGEDVVSHWGVWGYNMRVGSALLKTGFIGAVATREDQRKQGLMTRSAQLSLEAMHQAGYDLSVLHGYTHNYARFGYVHIEQAEAEPVLHCLEAVGEVELVLAALGQLAEQRGCEHVVLETLPARHPLLVRLRRETVRETTYFQKDNGWMVRTINLAGALDKLRAELRARLSHSAFKGWEGDLVIGDGRETVSVKFKREDLQVVPGGVSPHQVRGGEAVAQLLIGTDHPLEVADAAAMTLTGDARALTEVLFPAQHPSLAAWDQV